jgi:hypothetical protein
MRACLGVVVMMRMFRRDQLGGDAGMDEADSVWMTGGGKFQFIG